jgi:hypothetical protein
MRLEPLAAQVHYEFTLSPITNTQSLKVEAIGSRDTRHRDIQSYSSNYFTFATRQKGKKTSPTDRHFARQPKRPLYVISEM